MKSTHLITSLFAVATLFASGCTTVTGPNGQPQGVMTPMGAAVVQTLTSTAIGAGTGAMMHGSNPVAIGAVSAGAGSVGGQVLNAFIPQASSQPQPVVSNGGASFYQRRSDGSFVPASVSYQQMSDGSVVPVSSSGRRLYRLLPNGAFAPLN